jgi:hypothetical protein
MLTRPTQQPHNFRRASFADITMTVVPNPRTAGSDDSEHLVAFEVGDFTNPHVFSHTYSLRKPGHQRGGPDRRPLSGLEARRLVPDPVMSDLEDIPPSGPAPSPDDPHMGYRMGPPNLRPRR